MIDLENPRPPPLTGREGVRFLHIALNSAGTRKSLCEPIAADFYLKVSHFDLAGASSGAMACERRGPRPIHLATQPTARARERPTPSIRVEKREPHGAVAPAQARRHHVELPSPAADEGAEVVRVAPASGPSRPARVHAEPTCATARTTKCKRRAYHNAGIRARTVGLCHWRNRA